MKKLSKCLTAAIIILSFCLTSIELVSGVFAQSTSSPVVPQFTLTFQDSSRIVEPVTFYTTDPYTGKQTATGSTMGGFVTNQSIRVRITNQPFNPYTDTNNNLVQVYYDVRWKGQFADSWEGTLSRFRYIAQDSSQDYTDIRLGFSSNYWSVEDDAQINWHALDNPVDIQVRACIGYVTQSDPSSEQIFNGGTGDWSGTQTIVASQISSSPSPTMPPAVTQTPTTQATAAPTESIIPTNTGTFALNTTILLIGIIVALLVVVVVLAVALFRKDQSSNRG